MPEANHMYCFYINQPGHNSIDEQYMYILISIRRPPCHIFVVKWCTLRKSADYFIRETPGTCTGHKASPSSSQTDMITVATVVTVQ